MAVKLSSSL